MNTKLKLSIGVFVLGTLLCHGQADANANTDAEKVEGDIIDLETYQVVASADASADGLSEAYTGGQVASGSRLGILGTEDFLSSPFDVVSYTEELIQNQQAASVGEVLLNDAAVRTARGFGNFQQLYMVRGLPVYSDDMAYNGLYGLLPRQYLAAELIERVEVLRGANAFLNGAAPGGSGLGGAINVMPKRAPSSSLTQVTGGIQSGGQVYGALDWGRRFADESWGVRVNSAVREGDTAVDGESTSLQMFVIGLDTHAERFRVSADLGYQNLERDATQPSITIGGGLAIPDAPSADKSVAQPWTFSDEKDLFATIRSEFDLNDALTFWAGAGVRQSEEANSFANPTVYAADGTGSAYRFDNVREDDVATGEIGACFSFDTTSVSHRIVASATTFTLESKNAYAFSNFGGFAYSIYAPVAVDAPAADFFVGGDMSAPLMTEKTKTQSFAIADTLSFMEDRVLITAGLRQQQIETYSYNYNSGELLSSYSESAVTPVGGLVVRINDQFSLYSNYIEGLVKGDVAPATSGGVAVANAGEALDPYAVEQWEAGLKFDFGNVGGSLGIYQSEKPISGVNAAGVFGVVDDQTNKGLSLNVFGEPVAGWRLLGGVSLIDTDVDGKESIGAPGTQFNIGTEWDANFLPGLTLQGRYLYTGSQWADSANTQEVPSWTRLDLGMRYTFELDALRSFTVRARLENVLDEDYWASAGGYPGAGYLTVGVPRTWMLSGTFEF